VDEPATVGGMDHRRSFADHARDSARVRAVRDVDPLPPGPSLGLVGLDLPATGEVAPRQASANLPELLDGPAVVNDLDCESEASRVDDWRIAINKVLAAVGWTAGTRLDAHVDLGAARVWLRLPTTATPCTCDCGHAHPADEQPAAIPGVDQTLPGCVHVQSRGRVKLPPNLLKLLGADRHGGRITATTVSDLDAVLLVGVADYLRRLLPDLTAPAGELAPDAADDGASTNVRHLHTTA
jgi:hypothetical protein